MKKISYFMILFFIPVMFSAMPVITADQPVSAESQANVEETLALLEEKMEPITSMKTRFTQIRNLKAFSHEVRLSGTIFIEKPHRLAWHTEEPIRHSILFEKDKIRQWNEDMDRVEEVSFSDVPALKMMMEQMKAWFYGSYGDLTEQYEVRILSQKPLTLEFIPREKSLSSGMIKTIRVQFQKDQSYIESIQIEEAGGDRSTLLFSQTVLNAELDPEVWEVNRHAA